MQHNNPSRKSELGINRIPNQPASLKSGIKNDIQRMTESSNAALNVMGIDTDRLTAPLPIPSATGANTNIGIENETEQWQDPDQESDQESNQTQEYQEYSKPQNEQNSLLKMHPVLRKLRQEFGIESVKYVDVPIKNTVWKMKPLSSDGLAYALRIADSLSASVSEHTMKLSIARVACAIVAIDGVPLYQIFNIKIDRDEVMRDQFNPPLRVQRTCSNKVYDMLVLEQIPGLARILAEKYEELLEPLTELNNEMEYKTTYKCNECGNTKKHDTIKTEGGELKPFYCELDGNIMEPVMTPEEASDSPLA